MPVMLMVADWEAPDHDDYEGSDFFCEVNVNDDMRDANGEHTDTATLEFPEDWDTFQLWIR